MDLTVINEENDAIQDRPLPEKETMICSSGELRNYKQYFVAKQETV